MSTARPTVGIAMELRWMPLVLGDAAFAAIREMADVVLPVVQDDFAELGADLASVEVLITGWGSPRIDAHVLSTMPRLRAVLHAAGSVKGHLLPDVWRRGVVVTSAADANAMPVAEYVLAMILLAGKGVPARAAEYATDPAVLGAGHPDVGNLGRVVGIVGASRIGRRVIELLQPFDVEVIVADPTLDRSATVGPAAVVGIDELFRRADVISLHAPLLPETVGLVSGSRIASMRPGATLINSARGALVDEAALVDALRAGRIRAVLDVTVEEPLPMGHPLRQVPGVVLTPHVAGAQGNELRRLGDSVIADLRRIVAGSPPHAPVSLDALDSIA
jgi:phosphoglycerate dehydrogenase-like enzyme